MYIRTTPLQKNMVPVLPSYMNPDQVLFFDIETSGFSAEVTTLYLIGCIYKEEGIWKLVQWFADDNHSEAFIIQAFLDLSHRFRYILHYNGNGFDIPYLTKRSERYQIPFEIPGEKSIDIYKILLPYKKLLNLPSLKQKMVESFLGITRKDRFDGGELIQVYAKYIKSKYGHLPDEEELLDILLLHNAEDLTGLLQITPLLSIPSMTINHKITSASMLNDTPTSKLLSIQLGFDLSLPKAIQISNNEGIVLYANDKGGCLTVPLLEGELKYFYSNYKDYYYLPMEDMAIHKSVATYVDKEFRTKAKASTCYIRRKGTFVPLYQSILEPCYYQEYHDSISWFETNDSFLSNAELLSTYVNHLIDSLLIHNTNKK